METNKPTEQSITDKKITLSMQELITYTFFLVTFGASVFTFYQAIPEIKELDSKTDALNTNITVSNTKIEYLGKAIENLQKNQK